MNKIIASIFIFLLLILQVAFMPHLAFFGVFPDILLAAMMILAVLRGGKWVFILSLLSGLALDVFSNHPFGIYALDFILLTWLTEYVGKNIFRATDISGQVSLLALACVVFTSLNLSLIKVFYWLGLGNDLAFWHNFLVIGLLEISYNFVLAVLGLIIFKKIHGLFAAI